MRDALQIDTAFLAIEGSNQRYDRREDGDDFSHPRALHAILDNAHRECLDRDIAERQLALFDTIDPACGAGVRNAIAQGAEGSETALP